jgi:hypothetical protein
MDGPMPFLSISIPIVVMLGCHSPQRPVIEFYSQPKVVTPWCSLDEPPHPPELRDILSDQDPDVIDRVMVHRREWRELLDYLHLVELWQQQTNVCLGKLTE